ncbi:oxysterol binding protein [Blastomyces gilchristii SLH14081]|uniref:Oxysterol binding protein n=1 Tax=Blastomyces gilchristii (strain SLH14081) TaxID=559298 RepID=A0A179V0E9_BLAGS|nr:oxysterol binding protein [Blastomyces gilchristii SLH14081]OAT13824.1 oxysterol binding protein [Blastomyces gilchristii SLH14081]
MAGMEELEIHSKSYLVRWINVRSEHTISWSIQPHKKSLNFGIFKHPGPSGNVAGSHNSSESTTNEFSESNKENNKNVNSSSVVTEKLRSLGLKPIQWIGKCEADKISQGTYDVNQNEGGNYALVFDNTFSKQISKTATFVLLTYPSHAPPHSGHQVHHSQATGTVVGNLQARPSPALHPTALDSTESLRPGRARANSKIPPPSADSSKSFPLTVHAGILQKRRRKRHQGYARRFFSLNFTSSTLSYYHDRNSSALRGAIPLNLAVIATNQKTREISIDSGVEIWHLRASNDSDFLAWKRALEKASQNQESSLSESHPKTRPQLGKPSSTVVNDVREWEEVEALVEKVSNTRDMVRRLAKDTDPKYLGTPIERRERSQSPSTAKKSTPSQTGSSVDEAVENREKRSFWKLKPRDISHTPNPAGKRNISPQTTIPPSNANVPPNAKPHGEVSKTPEQSVHDDLMIILQELNYVVSEFSTLMLDKKQKAATKSCHIKTRPSFESEASQEFFDATDGNISPLLTIQRDSDDEYERSESPVTADGDDESLSGSEMDEGDTFTSNGFRLDNSSSLFPAKPRSLAPLPLDIKVVRRTQIPPPAMPPPSLISFLRRNVGKDLSTISMPVSANEPMSLLQRAAEQFEYSQLLDNAASATDGLERLIYVTAFALSPLSNARVKERAIRKPFNPMLGETFELIREDRGFRFIAEKVSHRPVQLAYQADSKDWSFIQSPKPTQKFWGKSAEIITDGKARLTLHSNGEHFSWSPATCFLRNIIAGEKYVEPVGQMCVLNETTGQKTIATFKTGGVFSGRSEEVSVKAFDTHGGELPLGLQGSWTSSLQLTEHGVETNKTIWAAGPLVAKPTKNYGYTSFAASLNEITDIEKGKIPVTDSRLRPDQLALEEGDVDHAEHLKTELEERQRERRREMEERGEHWRPRWFVEVVGEGDGAAEDETVWKMKTGKDGYWEERARGEWTGIVPVFKL